MSQPITRLKFGAFMGPFHPLGENPTLALHRDLELIQWLDGLRASQADVAAKAKAHQELRREATEKAERDYQASKTATK